MIFHSGYPDLILKAIHVHHFWPPLDWWGAWISVVALPLTLLGLLLTWRQAKAAVTAAQAAQSATRRTARVISTKQLMLLVPQLHQTLHEFSSAIDGNNAPQARRDLDRWRYQAASALGILSTGNATEKRLQKAVNASVALAQEANLALRNANGAISSHCDNVYAAMVEASDVLTAWLSRNSIDPQPESDD